MPDDIPIYVRADRGVVNDACHVLATAPALRDHVTIQDDHVRATVLYRRNEDIPYDLWGSGAQGMWRLLAACAYRGATVSLLDVVARLDRPNRIAVQSAIHCLTAG